MQKITYTILVLFVGVIGFFTGVVFEEFRFPDLHTYQLKKEISIQHSPENIGTLPEGTTIYEYRAMGETTTYLVFFNLENPQVFESIEFEHKYTINPLSGYLE